MSRMRFMFLGLLVLFVMFFSSYSLAAPTNQEAGKSTHGHAKKKGSGVSHYVVDQKKQAKIEGDLSKGKGHAAKTEDTKHFHQGEAARESAESGEMMESHPHSHKSGEGAEHYEPNK
ncbi:MAG: hypothetical protein HZC17_05295 [Candidatus Omnitrophica bacterium]|nr:hypothetical protein [Candidatus Omnitrophota bacterium]